MGINNVCVWVWVKPLPLNGKWLQIFWETTIVYAEFLFVHSNDFWKCFLKKRLKIIIFYLWFDSDIYWWLEMISEQQAQIWDYRWHHENKVKKLITYYCTVYTNLRHVDSRWLWIGIDFLRCIANIHSHICVNIQFKKWKCFWNPTSPLIITIIRGK